MVVDELLVILGAGALDIVLLYAPIPTARLTISETDESSDR
jgi:hypothetical protein